MKARVCPECQHQNLENAWDCIKCGETLPMSCLIDTSSLQSANPLSNNVLTLSAVSPYFQEDFFEHKDVMIQSDECMVRGFNITKPARFSPYQFGYLIITSKRAMT